ncbi:MAG: sigma-54-dependent Fis family transcriptional regulator [Syntrophaceae bacterium]|nr:sigma-54-dependent Fis family transcriptional regulator [Syntrophaceae bacterium]
MKIDSIRKKLLIIDDDEIFCDAVKEEFSGPSLEVLTAYTAKDGLKTCKEHNIDIILLDEKLPDSHGHRICPDILDINDQSKILFITAHPSFENAIQAIRAGAHDYLLKPFELAELRMSVRRALQMQEYDHVRQIQSYKASKDQANAILVGSLGRQGDVYQLIKRASEVDSPVLITGDTGTGKNVVARHIHYASPFREAPFIFVNCATLPENLIESELFGHEKGAFTGAIASRKGVFELAEGGTLFLDEIATMPLSLQAKLLGILDTGSLRRLGGQTQIKVNVRIIAATNADLDLMMSQNQFRKDLYYRLNVLCIHIPPLSGRVQDIPEFCRHFITLFGGNPETALDSTEISLLQQYSWPGNVRELRNILERSYILHKIHLHPSELLFGTNEEVSFEPCNL